MIQPVVLVAASGLAREVAAVVENSDIHEIVGVLDDEPALHGTDFVGTTIIGSIARAGDLGDVQFVICAGSGTARRRIAGRLAAMGIGTARFATIVHSSAVVPSSCRVGSGSVLLAYVTMTADVSVGEHVVLMPQAVLTHDDVVGDFATVCAGVVLGGTVRVESGAYLGMNSSVRQGLRVGRDAVLGMGSVLLQDLPAEQTWVGVPASPLTDRSSVPLAQVLDIHGRQAALQHTERHDAQ